ncbi:MAG: hypothetical protein WB810_10250 [Candidatus Cybelea sp.]
MERQPSEAITYIAATRLEFKALRREMPRARIVEAGIALTKVACELGDVVVSCGLAGGLRDDLATGTLLIPREIRRPDGRTLLCDDELVEAFADSARRLGVVPVFDGLLTSENIVNGAERGLWAAKGFAGVDMESGLLRASRVAAVRVVLDTPRREISADWASPWLAILKPWNWSQALWLAREAPRAASLAARVVAGRRASQIGCV